MPGNKIGKMILWAVALLTSCAQSPPEREQRDATSQYRSTNQLVFRLARSQNPAAVVQHTEQLLADVLGAAQVRVQPVASGLFVADYVGEGFTRDQLRAAFSREFQTEWLGFGLTGPNQEPVLPSGRVLVKFASGYARQNFLNTSTVFSRHEYQWGTTVVEVREDPVAMVESLRGQPGILHAEVDLLREIEPHFYPSDPMFSRQWHLDNTGQQHAKSGADVDAPEAWDISQGAPEIVIAIIDSGVSGDNEDLQDCKLVPGLDVTGLGPADATFPAQKHGTACAGVAAANMGNALGVAGLCPRCRVLPIRFLLEQPRADFSNTRYTLASDFAEAFEFAVDNGADILSNSWGTTTIPPQPLLQVEQDAIDYAITTGRNGLGSLVLFSAGNSNLPTKYFPYAAHPKVMAIAASDDQDRRSYYSNYGDEISVAAPSNGGQTSGIWTTDVPEHGGYNPGHSVFGDRLGNYTNSFGGTSSACPLVAGLAGLVMSVDPTLTALEVREIIESTADKIDPQGGEYQPNGHSWQYGFGRINAAAAVKEALTHSGAGSTGAPCSVGCRVDHCLPDPFAGDYCSRGCTANDQCPDGFVCTDAVASDQTQVKACVREFVCDEISEVCGDQVDNDGDQQVDEDCQGCAGETFEGRCDGVDVVYCESEKRGPQAASCDTSNACGRLEGLGMYSCRGCGEAEARCEGNVLYECWHHRSGDPKDNIYVGEACPEECSSNGEPHCVCDGGTGRGMRCDGDDLVICLLGGTNRIPCTTTCTETGSGSLTRAECDCGAPAGGECQGDDVVRCNFAGEQRFTCPNGCEMVDTGNGVAPRCVCNGVDPAGECQGNTLRRCSGGQVTSFACPETCGSAPDGTPTCLCATGLASGERQCAGNTLQSCLFGESQERTCHSCEMVKFPPKYYPSAPSEPLAMCGCANSTLAGHCDGETLVYCWDGEEKRIDCAHGCGVAPDSDGFASCLCKEIPMTDKCDASSTAVLWHCMRDGTIKYEYCEPSKKCGCDQQSKKISCTSASNIASDPSVCAPQCPPGTHDCGGDCVDTKTSQRHCGGCDQDCDQLCDNGHCVSAPTFTIFGAVTDSETQTPVPGAALTLSELSQTSSASDGSYSLSGARSGDYYFSVYAEGYQATALTVMVEQADVQLDVPLRRIGFYSPTGDPDDGGGPTDDTHDDTNDDEGQDVLGEAVGYPCAGTSPVAPLWLGIWLLWRQLRRRQRG